MSPVSNGPSCFRRLPDHLRQISDVIAQLFPDLPEDRLLNFSCGHIIPASNLQTMVVNKGPRGGDFEFKFDKRGDKSTVSFYRIVLVG